MIQNWSLKIKENNVSLVWRCHVGALPRGTNMAAVKQQKDVSLRFAEKKRYYSRGLTHNSFRARTVQLEKLSDNSSFDLRENILEPPAC